MSSRSWASGTPPDQAHLDKTTRGKQVAGAVVMVIRNKIRDTFRKKLNNSRKNGHNVKLTITMADGRKASDRRKPGCYFRHEENVTGWGAEKHKQWLARKEEKDDSSSDSDGGGNKKDSITQKKGTGKVAAKAKVQQKKSTATAHDAPPHDASSDDDVDDSSSIEMEVKKPKGKDSSIVAQDSITQKKGIGKVAAKAKARKKKSAATAHDDSSDDDSSDDDADDSSSIEMEVKKPKGKDSSIVLSSDTDSSDSEMKIETPNASKQHSAQKPKPKKKQPTSAEKKVLDLQRMVKQLKQNNRFLVEQAEENKQSADHASRAEVQKLAKKLVTSNNKKVTPWACLLNIAS